MDVASESGVHFQHVAGNSGDYAFPEIMGSGVALFDADGDGDLDLYALQGGSRAEPALSNRYFRNDSSDGVLRFVDATESSGLADRGYSTGVATGDIDNDGDVDLVVTAFGPNHLYRNNGAGVFALVGDALLTGESEGWTTSASFADVDGDGDLDLFMTDYVAFTSGNNIRCNSANGERDYCAPTTYPPTVDQLWRNDGDGQFTNISDESGIASAAGNGLGASAADFDGDGDVDIFVANDQMENRLWTQGADGRFSDTALMAGTAYNGNGAAEASMGVTAGDYDGDGDEDLFMTHLAAETNTLYANDGSGNFFDVTDSANLGAPSLRLTGFGTGWIDYDNDGHLDLFIANGAVTVVDDAQANPDFPYGQPNQLLRNEQQRFVEASREAGVVMQRRDVSRGAAFGDVDNDGDVDVVVSNANGPLQLLRNDLISDNGSLQLTLQGTTSARDGSGARVVARLTDGRELWRRAHSDGSYQSASDGRITLGLGNSDVADLAVFWPLGRAERFDVPPSSRRLSLVEGTGVAVAD
ncbi:MAG: CRTAC1 family protein [Gammaproteobacteria bacterium]